jgi:bisphosphoglycerate-dependent phosphoglycerate mutase
MKDQCYWSQQDGNGTLFWKDAALTPKGNDQALAANRFWKEAVNTLRIPIPGAFYTSLLARCLTTVNLTFSGVQLGSHYVPVVKEVSQQSMHTIIVETLNQVASPGANQRLYLRLAS